MVSSRSEASGQGETLQGMQHSRKLDLNRSRILIVEDERVVAENLKDLLEDQGYQVVGIADSGEEAVAIFTDKNPDLILMDVQLAGRMDGIQTAIVIHYTMKPVRILFLTAHSKEQFPHLGAIKPPLYKYLIKPYHPKAVTDAVAQLLNSEGS